MNKIFNNILSLSIGELFARFFNFLTYAYLARIILPNGFGSINFASAFIAFFILFVSFGFDTIAIRHISKTPEELPRYWINITITKFIFGLISYGMLVLIVSFTIRSVLIQQVIMIYGISIFSSAIVVNWVYKAIEKTFPIAIAQFVSGLFNLIVVIILIHEHDQVIRTIWIFVISGFMNSLILLLFLQKYITKIIYAIDIQLIKKIFVQALPIALSLFMISIYYNMDQVMLGFMTSQTEVGYYAAAYKILLVAILPSAIILNAFFPQLAKVTSNIEKRNKLMQQFSLLMFSLGMFIGIVGITFSKQIILATYGIVFIPSATLLSILMINSIIIFINMTYGNPLLAWGLEKKYLIAISLGALSNIIFNFILIPKYQAQGAALATLFSEIIVLLGVVAIHYSYTRKLYFKNLVSIFGISAVSFIVGNITLVQSQNQLLTFLVILIVFISALFLIKLISYERLKRLLFHEI